MTSLAFSQRPEVELETSIAKMNSAEHLIKENVAITAFSDEDLLSKVSAINMATSYKKVSERKSWYYAPPFLLFWLVIFFAVVLPVFFHLPDAITIENESMHPGQFIAERAERILFDFDAIGPKVVGSFANENLTVQLLLDEVQKIQRVMHNDLFELEIDIQQVSGAYLHWTMVNMYQGIQNFVVKLSSKNSTSQSYLLLNSHFDSKPGSPGAGDNGSMLVVMLEMLRVLATTRQKFTHPIVFLFNGAEENPLQASHGFVTQHKWAQNCKAVINLDSAGSGHKELLFQSGPKHPWLLNYYGKHMKRPYALTVAEEIFQANFVPSDSDFRIWKNYGKIPGLDLAYTYNGYVYHTKFDRFNVVPRESLQSTGENLLELTRGLSNASELENPEKHASGHTIFYDFLGLFFVYYTETQGVIMNACISVAAILIVGVSLWRMAATSFMSLGKLGRLFIPIFFLHLLGFILGITLPILMALIFDSGNRSMTWFTHKWLILGLYTCPTIIGLAAPTLLYFSFNRSDKLSQSYKLQMALHSHCIILSLLCIVGTCISIRSTYMLMITILFYICSLILNLLTKLHDRGYYWIILLMISQIIPFLYISCHFYALIVIFIPMMGRNGSASNPDFLIGGITMLGTILALGFLSPMLSLFRRPKMILLSMVIVVFIFAMLAITPLGFPYRAKTQVGRANFLHVRRVFYEYDKSVSRNESGYYFDMQDRRMHYPFESTIDLSKLQSVNDDCEKYMMCGLPVYNHRWFKARKQGKWLPMEEPVALPSTPTLTLLQRTTNVTTKRARFEFELSGPSHMSIFLLPLEGVTVTDWSFLKEMLQKPEEYPVPYHIYFSYGNDNTPLKFYFDLKTSKADFVKPLFELGISAHYVSFEHDRSDESKRFIKSFPDYIYVMEWPSSYERYIF